MAAGHRSLMLVLVALLRCALLSTGERTRRQSVQVRSTEGLAHVTRLHRYDHSGLAAMMEAEALWHTGASSLAQTEDRFLRLSKQQLDWLHRHHQRKSALVQMMGGESVGSVQSHGLRGTVRAAQATLDEELPTTMLSSLDSQYVGPIGIGTVTTPAGCQAQSQSLLYMPHARADSASQSCHAEEQAEIFVVFDTGSTNLWVSSDLCTTGSCLKKDRVHYNHSLSQTFGEPEKQMDLHVQFGTGSLDGRVGVDDLHVGPFTIYNQSFGMIEKANGAVFDNLPLEGILGLAFPAMAAKGSSPFFDTIITQKALKSNTFTFYFSRTNPSANAIFWGSVDKNFHEGEIEYFPVTDPFYWSLDLLSFRIGGQELMGDGKHADGASGESSMLQVEAFSTPKAVVDTGTTFFTASGSVYDAILSKLPGVVCDRLTDASHPPIVFTLRNEKGEPVDFELKSDQYMAASEGYCSPAFMEITIPSKHGPGMILGEVFLRQYLAVFDRGDGTPSAGRVGFARATNGDHVEERLRDLTHNQASFEQARRRL